MRAGPIVIFHVTEQQVTEVALAEYNNVHRRRKILDRTTGLVRI
jgi:hypothetical protein